MQKTEKIAKTESTTQSRAEDIVHQYFDLLDAHLDDIVHGRAVQMMQLKQIASLLFVSHYHLTDVVKQTTGHHPCYFYDRKIIEIAQKMLAETALPISEIAITLTYDPSNFSKFFKKMTGQTPGHFRSRQRNG
ncbi:helix-turn-helix domain-containing protein [Chitinophaga defluvii]|uniref:AraC family transcriptional regulator n=1 Tax=Chitinophaga defluvii TaxID=3163343 RepID=A0ABV2SYM7_9BACT